MALNNMTDVLLPHWRAPARFCATIDAKRRASAAALGVDDLGLGDHSSGGDNGSSGCAGRPYIIGSRTFHQDFHRHDLLLSYYLSPI